MKMDEDEEDRGFFWVSWDSSYCMRRERAGRRLVRRARGEIDGLGTGIGIGIGIRIRIRIRLVFGILRNRIEHTVSHRGGDILFFLGHKHKHRV